MMNILFWLSVLTLPSQGPCGIVEGRPDYPCPPRSPVAGVVRFFFEPPCPLPPSEWMEYLELLELDDQLEMAYVWKLADAPARAKLLNELRLLKSKRPPPSEDKDKGKDDKKPTKKASKSVESDDKGDSAGKSPEPIKAPKVEAKKAIPAKKMAPATEKPAPKNAPPMLPVPKEDD